MTNSERLAIANERVTRLVLVMHLETQFQQIRQETETDNDAGWLVMRHDFSHLIPATEDKEMLVRIVRNHWQAWYMDGIDHVSGELLQDTTQRLADRLKKALDDHMMIRQEMAL